MCYYHAYTHRCGHTEMVFQKFCATGQMCQKKCPRTAPGEILTTVKLEYNCSECNKASHLHQADHMPANLIGIVTSLQD